MKFLNRFWAWYERRYTVNIGIASLLFALQLIHLYWLTSHVVFLRWFGTSLFNLSGAWEFIIVLVDYAEIPAILGISLIYLNILRKRFHWKSILFLIFLNSQWLHIFWITDEFVIEKFTGAGAGTILPIWLAWAAILIDYLELPVIYDTLKRFFRTLGKEGLKGSLGELRAENGSEEEFEQNP